MIAPANKTPSHRRASKGNPGMLIRQTILYAPAQIFGPLIQFVGAVVWTHWLAPEAYGVLTFVLAAQELVFLVSLAWWSQFTMRYVGAFDDDERRSVYLRTEGLVLVVAAAAQMLLSLTMLLAVAPRFAPSLALATIAFSVTRSATAHLSERARAHAQIGVYTVAQTAGPIFGFVLAFLLIATVSRTPEAALFGFAAPQAIALAWLWRRLGVIVEVNAFEPEIISKAMRFGLPLVAAGAIAWVGANGIRVIVQYLDSPEAMGLIAVGWGLGQRLAATVAMLVTAAAFPLAVRHMHDGDRKGALKQLASSGALLFAVLAPATAGLVVIAPQLINLTIAESFRPITLAVLPISAVAGGVRNMRVHFADQSTLLFERTDLTILINALEAAMVVVGCLVGLRQQGLVGAAEGACFGLTVGAIFSFGFARRRFGLIVPFARMFRICVATAAMVAALLWSPWAAELANHRIIGLLVQIVVGALVYLVSMAALHPAQVRALAKPGLLWSGQKGRDAISRIQILF